jgi:hypothetical protein
MTIDRAKNLSHQIKLSQLNCQQILFTASWHDSERKLMRDYFFNKYNENWRSVLTLVITIDTDDLVRVLLFTSTSHGRRLSLMGRFGQ